MGVENINSLFQDSGFSAGTNTNKTRKLLVCLDPEKWKKHFLFDSIPDEKWITVKYLNSKGKESSDFLKIPDDAGGVFMWLIKPKKVPNFNLSVIVCICFAETGVLRTIRQFIENSERQYRGEISVKNMFDLYSNDLFVSYYADETRADFVDICVELNEMIDPPIKFVSGKLSATGVKM